ncbi:MAG: tRNA (N(6)-L-threonylcarbamoyladenosine(37)-C(2))-methylthiotransferase MtaB, partial [Bacteroidetes bacterium]|nr:tRNA (N(6)-L-threonylcarbamoyladenosine(37)-C(2))-methylthiotransferase MtaB [Bacteroidota bacterium]
HAIDLPGPIPVKVRHNRSKQLRMLSHKKRRFFYEQFIGENRPVLFEGKEEEGMMYGFTDNYIKIITPYKKGITNSIQTQNLLRVNHEGIMEVDDKVKSFAV